MKEKVPENEKAAEINENSNAKYEIKWGSCIQDKWKFICSQSK